MQPIAHITQEIIDLLGLPCQGNTPIYLGQTNRHICSQVTHKTIRSIKNT